MQSNPINKNGDKDVFGMFVERMREEGNAGKAAIKKYGNQT